MLLAAESALASARVNDEGDARPAIEAVLELAERWPALAYLRDEALLVSLTSAWDLGWAVHAVRGAALLEPLLEAGAGGNHAATPGLAKARLHALAGRLDEARAGFEAERTGLTREGRRPLRAIVDHDEGVALAAGGGVATAAASALLQQAGDAFARLGMEGWQARAQRLLDEGFAAAAQPGGRLHFTYPLSLSRREIDLVRLLTGGAVLAEAAALLEIDRPAAERHLAAALAKLGARGPADLPRLARRHGLAGQG
jgi:DNA-binding CsgD family transcriptional regulator